MKMNIRTFARRLSIAIAAISLLISCSDDDAKIDTPDYRLVTGIHLVDGTGQLLYSYGNPNDYLGSVSGENEDGQINSWHTEAARLYPVPARDFVNVYSKKRIKSIWLVSGRTTTDYQDMDFTELNSQMIPDTTGLAANSIIENHFLEPSIGLMIDVNELKVGFYKVVLEAEDDELYWTTFYKSELPLEEVENDIDIW